MVIIEENKKEIVIRLSQTEVENLFSDLEELSICNTTTDEIREELERFTYD